MGNAADGSFLEVPMPNVRFEKEGVTVSCNAGTNLRELAKKNHISVYSNIWKVLNCRGNGLCEKCEVEIVEAENLSPRTRMEEIALQDKHLTHRLSCQVFVHGDMTVRTHPEAKLPPAS